MRFWSALLWFVRGRSLAILLLTTASAWQVAGQTSYVPPFPQSDTSQAATHVLTGTVTNSVTGAPIPYALVQVGQSSRLADQNGNFRFENLAAGSVNLQAHKPGFFEQQELGNFRGITMVNLSDPTTTVTISLIPEAVISGHVEDGEGEPLANLPVRVRFGQMINGRRVWQQRGFRQTDEDGDFRAAELKPGSYYVEVGPNGRGRGMQQPQVTNGKFEAIPAEYYPGVREMSAATPIQLSPGQQVPLQFKMKPVPAFRISGAVVGNTTRFGGLNLLDEDGENSFIGVRFDNRTGRFQAFPVPAGNYRLHFNGRDSDGQQIFADVPISVTEDIPELRVPVERTIDIPLQIETDFTKNSSQGLGVAGSFGSVGGGVTTVTRMPGFYGQVRLISRTSSNRQYFTTRRGEEGDEAILGVEPGTYDVQVDANGASYVASATCAGVDVLHQPLVVAEGAEQQPIEVVLRDDGASLNGAVQISDGSKSALVLMVPEDAANGNPRELYVDPSGNFHLQNIAPGSYDILAFDRADGLEYSNREVLNAYLSRAAHVTLSADEQAKVTVDMIQTK